MMINKNIVEKHNKIVKVILVDDDDHEIGICEKIKAHKLGYLHRAFSIFIFHKSKNGIKLLIQQRHPKKYHCGGLWTNSCCSHPYPCESTNSAAKRRLFEEIGIKIELKHVGVFRYVAKFNNGLTENEYDHVYIGFYDDVKELNINKNEISDYKWVMLDSLKEDIENYPEKYTPWFAQALSIALESIGAEFREQ